ncbi:3-isopropylmalate/(R)-2-methylmalate dehydratase small subunit [Paraburkholderia caballeronis]|uniref:3-isopropylmalate dehydratase small subunit n=1 Tax=Paraburkholderia caballeronis TaxID=416943 RepID=UPI001064A340|nr:3-isopropylmalate dehydratase small subunit [Paraburkholderia caballeronis]TDV33639.1 3-isopropylmalate/(R)-2-methylmalate dehydratase small subunit [Paraburkholderia caballeronis]
MQPFSMLDALVVPIDRPDVDTDAILPKQYMKMTGRTGFGPYLFDEWRYLDPAEPGDDCATRRQTPAFSLNQPRYQGAGILLGRANFGCGSSREHAVWALSEWGIRALVAPSFAEIFRGNCLKNGLLPVVLPHAVVDALFDAVQATSGYRLSIDLHAQTVGEPEGTTHAFEIDPFSKTMLVDGLDEIGITLRHSVDIAAFERERVALEPWLADGIAAK